MRVAVTGASGNVGTRVLDALLASPDVEEVVAIARRPPRERRARITWHALDVGADDPRPALEGADAVVHAAWAIQPSRDLNLLWRTNVLGTARVARAAEDAGVRALVHLSSVGAYSPGPKDPPVGEAWPARGIGTAFYALHKGEAERILDGMEAAGTPLRIVRLRPGLIFQRATATHVRSIFLGPFVPGSLARTPLVPDIPGLRVQCVHARDVADAAMRAIRGDARGAFNIAADPPLDPRIVAEALGARLVPFPARAARLLAALSWRLRLQPTPPGWVDMALAVPVMDTTRARAELGWRPSATAVDALREVVDGMADGAGADTPVLRPDGLAARAQDVAGGVGAREA